MTSPDELRREPTRRRRGDVVVIRNIWEFPRLGRAAAGHAIAGRVVVDDGEIVVVATEAGSGVRARAGAGEGPNGRIVAHDTWTGEYAEKTWAGQHMVRVYRWGDPWSVWRWYDGTAWTDRWYGNLETPWRRAPLGFDTQDWTLDVVARGIPGTADWLAEYKDVDELEWMLERGLMTRARGDETRAAGERLMELTRAGAWPFDADWDGWAADPVWGPTPMPDGWSEIPPA